MGLELYKKTLLVSNVMQKHKKQNSTFARTILSSLIFSFSYAHWLPRIPLFWKWGLVVGLHFSSFAEERRSFQFPFIFSPLFCIVIEDYPKETKQEFLQQETTTCYMKLLLVFPSANVSYFQAKKPTISLLEPFPRFYPFRWLSPRPRWRREKERYLSGPVGVVSGEAREKVLYQVGSLLTLALSQHQVLTSPRPRNYFSDGNNLRNAQSRRPSGSLSNGKAPFKAKVKLTAMSESTTHVAHYV